MRLVLAALVLLVQQAPPARILFIGNSLTYANDLPAMVCALARAAGRQAVCASVAKPDYGLEEHWNEGRVQKEIARGWDVVVLQQGPSALPESRRLLVSYARKLDGEIRKAGARPALYMVWPSQTRRGDFPAVSQSYAVAARQIEGVLLPAGDAWRAVWDIDDRIQLYSDDGFHPSHSGSYLAAVVIYSQLFGTPPPSDAFLGEEPETARILQRGAAAAIGRLGR